MDLIFPAGTFLELFTVMPGIVLLVITQILVVGSEELSGVPRSPESKAASFSPSLFTAGHFLKWS